MTNDTQDLKCCGNCWHLDTSDGGQLTCCKEHKPTWNCADKYTLNAGGVCDEWKFDNVDYRKDMVDRE